jgi:hypothetical protein
MKAGSLFIVAAALAFALPARATVSIEFQLGGIEVPAGSIGVLVADVADNEFTSPGDAAGAVLSVGGKIGADDVIIAILGGSNLPNWGTKRGFANLVASIDYAALDVAEGQDLILHLFPQRNAGDAIRAGEPHLSYRTGDLGQRTSNSTMGFTLPRDGGAYLLAYLGAEHSGNADLAGLDLSALAYGTGPGSINRSLSSGTARHTYFFDVATPGIFSLDGEGVSGFRAELYGPDGDLIAANDGDISIVETLAAGFHTLVLFRNSGNGSLAYALDFSSSDMRPIIPDVAVGLSLTGLVGNNILGGAPGQLVSLASLKARPVTAYATVGNRSERSDTLAVRASAGTGLCRINYFDGNGSLITAQLLSGTFRTTLLDSADPATGIRLQFTPNKRRLVRKVGSRTIVSKRTFTSAVRADATVGPSAMDAGTIQVNTR